MFFGKFTVKEKGDTQMKLYTLGTSHGGTEVGRSCSANLLQYGDDFYLFDCGGDVEKTMKDMNLPIGRIKALFISHMHSDHIGNMHSVAKCFVCGYSKMDTVLKIHMPGDDAVSAFRVWAEAMCLNPDSPKLILNSFSEGMVYSDENIKVTAVKTEHLKGVEKPSYAFTVETADGKNFLYTGDLSCDFHDYPEIIFQKDFDLILSELVHFDIEKNLDTIIKSRTKKLIFTHLAPRNISVIESVRERFPFEVIIAHDGMDVDF